jgi:hypothetical protein
MANGNERDHRDSGRRRNCVVEVHYCSGDTYGA